MRNKETGIVKRKRLPSSNIRHCFCQIKVFLQNYLYLADFICNAERYIRPLDVSQHALIVLINIFFLHAPGVHCMTGTTITHDSHFKNVRSSCCSLAYAKRTQRKCETKDIYIAHEARNLSAPPGPLRSRRKNTRPYIQAYIGLYTKPVAIEERVRAAASM